MNRRLILIALTILTICTLSGQTASDSVMINFRQSKIYLDPDYMNNREALDHIARKISTYSNPDSNLVLTEVSVTGAASPEGSVRFNEWLSQKRAQRIFDYLGGVIELPDSLTSFTFVGRDWNGLRRLVEADTEVPYRAEVLSLLDEIIAGNADGESEKSHNLERLKALRHGQPYLYLYYKQFPKLRESRLTVNFVRPIPRIHISGPGPELIYTLTPFGPIDVPAPEFFRSCRPFYMGVKSNALYDLAAVPNIGVEFYLGKKLSIVANWMYGWWDTDRTHHYWRIYGGDIALRRWFGSAAENKPLTGHHVGIYGGVVTYDFEFGGTGYMGGLPGRTLWDRCNYVAGLEYGYSLPIARRWNIDFTIGAGYLGGKYIVYYPKDRCYVWKETRRRNYFGPTKAEISIVWLIGCDNYNVFRKKGGNR